MFSSKRIMPFAALVLREGLGFDPHVGHFFLIYESFFTILHYLKVVL